MVLYFTTKYKDNIKEDAKADFRSKTKFTRMIVMNNLYTFDDSQIKGGKKPPVKHGVKKEAITLTDEDYELISKVANHYNMDVTKFIAFIINQHYENKMNN